MATVQRVAEAYARVERFGRRGFAGGQDHSRLGLDAIAWNRALRREPARRPNKAGLGRRGLRRFSLPFPSLPFPPRVTLHHTRFLTDKPSRACACACAPPRRCLLNLARALIVRPRVLSRLRRAPLATLAQSRHGLALGFAGFVGACGSAHGLAVGASRGGGRSGLGLQSNRIGSSRGALSRWAWSARPRRPPKAPEGVGGGAGGRRVRSSDSMVFRWQPSPVRCRSTACSPCRRNESIVGSIVGSWLKQDRRLEVRERRAGSQFNESRESRIRRREAGKRPSRCAPFASARASIVPFGADSTAAWRLDVV